MSEESPNLLGETTSPRFSLNKHDGKKIGQVFLWSMMSAGIAFLSVLVPLLDIPPKYAALGAIVIPAVNTGLVTLKKWVDSHGSLL